MVKSPSLKVPAIVAAKPEGRWDTRVFKLKPGQIKRIGRVRPKDALRQAQTHGKGSLFRAVGCTVSFEGASNKGQSYKFRGDPRQAGQGAGRLRRAHHPAADPLRQRQRVRQNHLAGHHVEVGD